MQHKDGTTLGKYASTPLRCAGHIQPAYLEGYRGYSTTPHRSFWLPEIDGEVDGTCRTSFYVELPARRFNQTLDT